MAHFIPQAARYVESITIVNAGSGFTSVPTITISGGGGTGATATCEILNGEIFKVTVTAPGDGYTSAPTVTVSGGGGTNAELTPVLGYALQSSQYQDVELSYRIAEQFPQFFAEDYPKFIKFIEKYYEYMDQQHSKILNPDIEFYKGDYIDEWAKQLGLKFPKHALADKKLLYSHINDIYEAKGSIKSIKAFFKFVYNADVEVEYPSQFIFKTSDGLWVEEQAVKVQANTFENSVTGEDEEYSLFDLSGKAVKLKYFESVGSITLERYVDAAVQSTTKIAYTFPSSSTLALKFDTPRDSLPGPGAGASFDVITDGPLDTVVAGEADNNRAAGTYTIDVEDYTVESTYGGIKEITVSGGDVDRTAGTYKIDNYEFNQKTTSLTIAGTTATASFGTVEHGLEENQTLQITGAVPDDFNGFYKITNVTATTFDYTPTTTPIGTATTQPSVIKRKAFTTDSSHGEDAEFTVTVAPSTGVATVVIDNPGDCYEETKTIEIKDYNLGFGGADPVTITIDRVARAANFEGTTSTLTGSTVTVGGVSQTTATATFSEAHGLRNGQTVVITSALPVEYNGTYQIFNVTKNSFQYVTTTALVPATDATVQGSAKCGAEFTVVVDSNGAATVTIDDSGFGYTPTDTIVIPDSALGSGGADDLQLTVSEISNGTVDKVILLDAGDGYLAAPTLIVSDRGASSTASGATLDVTVENEKIKTITVTSAGSNYNSNEVVVEIDLLPVRTQILSSDNTVYGYLVRTLKTISPGVYSGSASDVGFRVGQIYDLSETGIASGYAVAPTPTAQSYFDQIVFSDITTSLTISGTTATATFSGNHGLTNGDTITISGAVPTEFNGAYTISNASGNTFDYTPASVPASDATVQGFAIKSVSSDDGTGYFGQPYVFVGGSRNARVRVASVSLTGVPLTWEIVGAGSDFVNQTTTLTLTSPNGEEVDVTITTGYLFNYDGFYRNDRGKPSNVNRIQDNYRYQNYSYVVKGPVQASEWMPTYKPLMHPAGLNVFGDFVIEHNIDQSTTFTIETEEIGIYHVLVDNVYSTEIIDAIDFTKVLADSTTVSETSSYSMGKVLTDSSVASETSSIDFTKVLSDSVTVTDSFTRVVSYVRNGSVDSEFADTLTITDTDFLIGKLIDFADAITASEAAEILTSSPESDSTSASDANTLGVTKVIGDNISSSDTINSINTEKDLTDTASTTETTVIQVDFTKSDSATTSDSGSVINQDYAEPGYFGDIYTGTGAFF